MACHTMDAIRNNAIFPDYMRPASAFVVPAALILFSLFITSLIFRHYKESARARLYFPCLYVLDITPPRVIWRVCAYIPAISLEGVL